MTKGVVVTNTYSIISGMSISEMRIAFNELIKMGVAVDDTIRLGGLPNQKVFKRVKISSTKIQEDE